MSTTKTLRLFLLLSFGLLGLWCQLDELNVGLLAVIIAFLSTDYFSNELAEINLPKLHPLTKIGLNQILLFLFFIAPTISLLIFNHKNEFPFGGDHGYHYYASQAISGTWGNWVIPALTLSIFYFAITRNNKTKGKEGTILLCLLLLISFFIKQRSEFARYPSAYYTINTILHRISDLLNTDDPFSWNALTNFLSIPFWVFVARPILFGRQIDFKFTISATLIFWQNHVSYYWTTSYIEPWAMILILLGLEATTINVPLALLLFALSAIFKEMSILLFALSTLLFLYDSFQNGRRKAGLIYPFVLGTPFLSYYFFRKSNQISRTFSIPNFHEIWNFNHVQRYCEELLRQLPPVELLISSISLAILIIAPFRNKSPFYLFGFIIYFLFFWLDSESQFYAGYSRFLLFQKMILAAQLFQFINKNWIIHYKKIIYGSIVLISALGYSSFKYFPKNATDRNNFEWPGTPIYFPIREGLSIIKKTSPLINLVSIQNPITTHSNISFGQFKQVYRDFSFVPTPTQKTTCKCSSLNPQLLIIFDRNDFKKNQGRQDLMESCRTAMNISCKVVTKIMKSEQEIALIGYL